MADLIEIASPALSAAIDPFGAELTHLRDAEGRELMTDADPAFWTGHAPILFPVIGMVNGGVIRLDGAEYPMPKHGFARHSEFALTGHDAASASFRLTDSAATRGAFPFAFALDLDFTLDGATLTLAATITNRGDTSMPAQFGFHPALAWPLPYGEPRADHRIVFADAEPERLLQLTPEGLIADTTRASPLEDRALALRDDLFTDDALMWGEVHSQRVSYGAARGPQLEVAFPDTPKLGIWTKPGAAYVCIEPWHGMADPVGFTGDFRDKPGVFEVAPRDVKHIEMRITLAA